MHVKIEQACFWGEGKDRKGYGAGSVIEVPEDIVERNAWMKPTDAALKAVAYNPDGKAKDGEER
jgi:hypothetical protein